MCAMGMDTWPTKMSLKAKKMNFKFKKNVLRKLIFPKLKEFYKLRVSILHIFVIVRLLFYEVVSSAIMCLMGCCHGFISSELHAK